MIPGILEGAIALGSMIIPPAFDFIKKKFVPAEADTPEATMGTLATTKPEVLPQYLTAVSGWIDSKIRFFNRDVVGTPSQWVVDLRAAIRPVVVVGSLVGLILSGMGVITLGTAATVPMSAYVGSWMGSRITGKK